jgi:hypothetical protein
MTSGGGDWIWIRRNANGAPPAMPDDDPFNPAPTPPGRMPPPVPPEAVPPPRPVLPLAHSPQTPPPPGSFGLRVVLGCVGYIVLTAGWWVMAARLRLDPGLSWGAWFVVTVALLGLALYVRVRYRRAGYGYGILLSFVIAALLVAGLVLLLIGMCFTGNLK